MNSVSRRIIHLQALLEPVYRFFTTSTYASRVGDPTICDFAIGNPHDMPLAGFADALQRWSEPQHKDWFAYPGNQPAACRVVAASLRERFGVAFEDEDIFLTNGAFAALSVVLGTILDPGDDVLFVSPPWFFYESLIAASGGRPVRVKVEPPAFDLDLDAIAAAINEHTRAIIINSPHNPTGRIYARSTLEELAKLLTSASEHYGRPISLISDEAYSRIVFDGRTFHSPTTVYPWSFLIYTYGKTLLAPGQRIGYIALPPTLPQREALRSAIFVSQLMTGYAFPNMLLQHALPDLEQLTIDVGQLQRKRDWLVGALREMGYDVNVPEGTFYLLPRSPLANDLAFIDRLAEHDIFCLPGSVVELPGYFRISLTANESMIERALPGFAAALELTR